MSEVAATFDFNGAKNLNVSVGRGESTIRVDYDPVAIELRAAMVRRSMRHLMYGVLAALVGFTATGGLILLAAFAR